MSGVDFHLHYHEGRARLGLRGPARLGIVLVPRLDLDVPRLRFPFEMSADPRQFQSRYCQLAGLEAEIDPAALTAWLDRRPRLARHGLYAPVVRFGKEAIQIGLRLDAGDASVFAALRLRIEPGRGSARHVRLRAESVSLFGPSALPATLLPATLAAAIGPPEPTPPGAQERGRFERERPADLDELEIDVVESLLWQVLPQAGFRLPRYRAVALERVVCEPTVLRLIFSETSDAPDAAGGARPGDKPADSPVAAGDRLLLAGQAEAAIAAYRATIAASVNPAASRLATERLLAVLLTQPRWFAEAERAAQDLLADDPQHLAARLGQAALLAQRGEPQAAALAYEQLGEELLQRPDHELLAERAWLRAAELHALLGSARATELAERVLEIAPDEGRAYELLALRFLHEQRYADLVKIERRRLQRLLPPAVEAASQRRLGLAFMRQLDQAQLAERALQRATELEPDSAMGWELYAEALSRSGQHERAATAIERAIDLDSGRPELHAFAAEICRALGDTPGALEHIEEALAVPQVSPAALERAGEVLSALGRKSEAMSTLDRALSRIEQPASRARVLVRLAQLAEEALADPAAARRYAERAVEYVDSADALWLLERLAGQEQRAEDRLRLLLRLSALGEARAEAPRIRLLAEIGRLEEAEQAAVALAERDGPGGLPVLAEVVEKIGDTLRLRAVLERLLAVSPSARPRLRLGQLLLAAGELDGAQRRLNEALHALAGESRADDGEARALRRAILATLCDVLSRLPDDVSLERVLAERFALADSADERGRILAQRGAALQRLGMHREAAESFTTALAHLPDDPAARVGLADACVALSDWAGARAALEPLHRLGVPPRVERALRLADLAERAGDPAGAIPFAVAALELGAAGTDATRAYATLGRLHHLRGDYRAEIRVLLEAANDERIEEPPSARAGRLVTAADLMRRRLDQVAEAEALYERALTVDPLQIAALDALEAMLDAERQPERLAQILSRKVAATARRPAQQKAILARLAELYATVLDRPDAAREAYLRATELDPSFAPALQFLAQAAQQAGRFEEERGYLERLCTTQSGTLDAEGFALFAERQLRLAELCTRLHDWPAAEQAARRLLDVQPSHGKALQLLEPALIQQGKRGELEQLLRLAIDLERDVIRADDLRLRRAQQLEQLGQKSEAAAVVEEVARRRPELLPRLDELLADDATLDRRLAIRVQRAEQLLADGDVPAAEQALIEATHLSHDRLHDPAQTRALLDRVLQINPQSRVAVLGLLALAQREHDVAEQDRLLGRLIDLEHTEEGRAGRLAERVRFREARGQIAEARALLAELPIERAPESLLRLRLDLAERPPLDPIDESTGTPQRIIDELRRRAVVARDEAAERFWLRRLFALLQGKGIHPAAEPYLTRLAELDPENREVAQALVDSVRARHLLLPCGPELAAALERLIAVEQRAMGNPDRLAELTFELARTVADQSPAAASVHLREALALRPGFAKAAMLQARLLQGAGQIERAMQTMAGAVDLPDEGHLLLGELHEQLGQLEPAAQAMMLAGDAVPRERLALVLEKAGRLEEALSVWRLVDSAEKRQAHSVPLMLLLANRSLLLGRPEEARNYATQAYLQRPQPPADKEALGLMLTSLDGPAALELAGDLESVLPPAAAARLYFAIADRFSAETELTALDRASALDPQPATLARLGELTSGEAAARSYRQALERAPFLPTAIEGVVSSSTHAAALRALEEAWQKLSQDPHVVEEARHGRVLLPICLGELYRDDQRFPEARALFERAMREAESLPAEDAARLSARARRGLVSCAIGSGERGVAEQLLREQLELTHATDADRRQLAELFVQRGDHLHALQLLRGQRGVYALLARCLEVEGQWQELLDATQEEAERSPPDDARRLLVRAADLAESKLGQPQKAAQLLERAITLGPASGEIFERLARLYFGPLADPHRGAAAAARALAADPQRAGLVLLLGDYHYDEREAQPAIDYYQRALASGTLPAEITGRLQLRLAEFARLAGDPAREERELQKAAEAGAQGAWSRLVELYRLRDDRPRLADALRHVVQKVDGLVRLAALRELLALVGPEEAGRIDEEIALLDPRDTAVRDRILSRLRTSGNLPNLADQLERFLEAAAGPARAQLSAELGRVAVRAGDTPRAQRAFRIALETAPSLDVALGLLSTLAPLGRSLEAAPLLAAAARRRTVPPEARRELARLVCEIQMLQGGEPAQALELLAELDAEGIRTELDPELRRSLLRGAGQFQQLLAEIDRATARTEADDEKLALTLHAVELLEQKLGQPLEAARRLGPIIERFPERRDLVSRARQLYAAAKEPLLALQLVEREMRLAAPHEMPQFHIARGELLLAAGADNEAEAALLRVLVGSPRSGRAHAALATVRKRRGDLAGAVEHLMAAAESPDLDPARAASCAVEAADLLLKEGDAATAERLYQLAASIDSSHRPALEGLSRLAEVRGEHERHSDLLGRVSALALDRKERAQLLWKRGRLLREHLDRDLDAYRAFKEAVAADPTLRPAIGELRAMAEERADWAVAIEQYRREIGLAQEASERARLFFQLGELYELRLLDVPEALTAYEESADLLSPENLESAPWERLVRLYAEQGRLHDAAEAGVELARTFVRAGEPDPAAHVLLRAAALYQRSSDNPSARRVLDEVAALGPAYVQRAHEAIVALLDETAPVQLQKQLVEQLGREPEGPARLDLLHRLLQVSARLSDDDEVDLRAQEILLRNPGDPQAFAERRRILQKRNDHEGQASLWRARAPHLQDSLARASAYFEAGRLAEQKQRSAAQAAQDYERAIAADSTFVPALDALADLLYRSRQIDRARELYSRLAELGSSLGHDEIALRRAMLAKEAGDLEEARALFTLASRLAPSRPEPHFELAELAQQRADTSGEYAARRAGLELLPLDDLDRLTQERLRTARLARDLGETGPARNFFELVLMVDPTRSDVLEELVRLYEQLGEYAEAAAAYERASQLIDDPKRRAEMLFRRGEILRSRLSQPEAANDAYLKAADLHPGHAPTLRRLIAYYYSEGDYAGLADVFRELDQLGAGPGELGVEAALGLALNGDGSLADFLLQQMQAQPATLAQVLGQARVRRLERLDPAIGSAVRALGGGRRGEELLASALRERLRGRPTELGAHLVLGRLYDLSGDSARATLHYGILAFVDDTQAAAVRLTEFGAPQALPIPTQEMVHPTARSSVRDALVALSPYLRGFPPAPVDAHSDPLWADRLRGVGAAFGLDRFEVAIAHDLLDPAWPAWLEPSTPPRLLLTRHLLVDEAAARFATARALHALSAGLPLVEGRVPEDVMGLVRAAAMMFGVSDDAQGPFVSAWLTELGAIGLRPAALPPPVRLQIEAALRACLADRSSLAAASAYCAAERLSADRVALAATGDFRAALVTLAPAEATTAALRTRALLEHPPLSELLSWIMARLDSTA